MTICILQDNIRVTHMHTLSPVRENRAVLEPPCNPGQAQSDVSHMQWSSDIIILIEKNLKTAAQSDVPTDLQRTRKFKSVLRSWCCFRFCVAFRKIIQNWQLKQKNDCTSFGGHFNQTPPRIIRLYRRLPLCSVLLFLIRLGPKMVKLDVHLYIFVQ